MAYPDMAANDAKSLTWTTAPLKRNLNVVGHPVVSLSLMSSTGDVDLHVLLEEVDRDGKSTYVTEGILRASHRETTDAPWNNLGLPYQRSSSRDPLPLLDEPTEVTLDLIPTAWTFNADHRMRLVVMGADQDNTLPSDETESPTIRVYREPTRPAILQLTVSR